MKIMKLLTAVLILAVLLYAAFSLNSGELDGTSWKTSMENVDLILEMNHGFCTCTVVDRATGKTGSSRGPYRIRGTQLLLDGEYNEFKLHGDTMTVLLDGETVVFKRQ